MNRNDSTMSDSIPNPEELKIRLHNALLQILKHLASSETARKFYTTPTHDVFHEVRLCAPVPDQERKTCEDILTGRFSEDSAAKQELRLSQFDLWTREKFGLERLEHLSVDPDACPAADSCFVSIEASPGSPSTRLKPDTTKDSGTGDRAVSLPPVCRLQGLPDEWNQLVPEIRSRLRAGSDPFGAWMLPQPQWRCEWLEAHGAISSKSPEYGEAIILVPDEEASQSDEARSCWFARTEAALLLRKASPSRDWARVLTTGNRDQPAWITLEKLTGTSGPLITTARMRQEAVSLDDAVLLGQGLCRILGNLNTIGVHLLDLTAERIIFERPPFALIHLLEPTAVVPASDLLPEWRGVTDGRYEGAEARQHGPAQVMLIGSILLSLICATSAIQVRGRFPAGRSATFALLAGMPQLADAPANRILEPLACNFEDRARLQRQKTHGRKLAKVLLGCLVEDVRGRYETVAELNDALKKCS
jgi:hypothetical protein